MAAVTGLTIPAAAQTQTVYVQLPTGEVVPVQVDVPPGGNLGDIQLPGTPVPAPTTPTTPTTPTAPTAPDHASGPGPQAAARADPAGAGPAGAGRAQRRRRLAAGAQQLGHARASRLGCQGA